MEKKSRKEKEEVDYNKKREKMISRKPASSKYVAVLNRGKREKRGENVPRRVEVCVACTKGQTDRDKEHFRTKARGESKVLLVLVYLSLLALALTPFG